MAAAEAVVALHATDPAAVFLAARARTRDAAPAAVEDALYDRRALLRTIAMRRTMWVVPTDLAPVVHAAATRAVAAAQRRRYAKLIAAGGLGDAAWLADVEREAHAELVARGSATGAELSAAVPRLRSKLRMNEGKAYEQEQSITTWVLFLLGADGLAVRGRPRGSWASSQYRWAPAEAWLPEGLGDLDAAGAQAELARRWLAAFGPATVDDLRWWTGWGVRDTRAALARLDVAEVELDEGPGIVLAGDRDPTPDPGPWVSLLPSLDPTAMGWKARGWYLGAHGARLFDRFGNVGPTVWSDGRIVGGWAQRPDGEVAVALLDDVGAEASAAVDAEAAALQRWIGDVRFVPRFPTPLERELRA